ncbi:MAG: CDP-alcohol phosphatidyltransferase family protein [Syntrophobacteraceae bacterium]
MTIPNILTIIRILLTPLLIWLLLDGDLGLALIVFLVAGMTDGLDGLIARVFNQKSKLGAYLDPLADKLLLVSSFIMLAKLGKVPNWLVVIAVSRDVIILLGMVTLSFHQVPVEIRPSGISKITTLLQLITVLSAMITPFVALPGWATMLLFISTAVFCIVSGFHYMKIGISLFDSNRNRNGE